MQSGIDVVLAINFTTQSSAIYNELPESIVDIGDELARNVYRLKYDGLHGQY